MIRTACAGPTCTVAGSSPAASAPTTGSSIGRAGGVGGAHGVAVHRRVVERRHGFAGDHWLGEHETRAAPVRSALPAGSDALEHVGAAPHRAGSHRQLSRVAAYLDP